jgi:hypothetical protein
VIFEELTASDLLTPPIPANAVIVKAASAPGGQNWVGSPSAVGVEGYIYLAYRLREVDLRGYAVEVARSADGLHFERLVRITKEEMDCESLERPALVLTDEGTWRLYLSCATPNTKHWRIELIEASSPDAFDPALASVVLPGDAMCGVKDPVIERHDGQWHLWASVHPLDDPDATDRMATDYATSPDGRSWTWQSTALAPRPDRWDARGVRVAAVRFTDAGIAAYYDGRATAVQNCEERTGIAVGSDPGELIATGSEPIAESPFPAYGLRYVTIVDLGGGTERLYYELTNSAGSHDLVTEVRPVG